ncbi:hypothetical protein M501DRAFT_934200 [Patellaria atrata CBS 101060]|uniref:Protein YAE1 n=1 Tax=Patellaria atrata CBS 101060 TaxID=1346257 RepID=A0A9P4SBZ2_9PEZI|nr:hypothetical protein M501DRAFT_934200 [Patellaria atrata CBS 101060]
MTTRLPTQRALPPSPPPSPPSDPTFDDIFGSAPSSPSLAASNPSSSLLETSPSTPLRDWRTTSADPSDIPKLRRVHVTAGYRDGVAASKEKFLQEGFDEGFVLGAEVGREVGWVLGVLGGWWDALASTSASSLGSGNGDEVLREVTAALEEAKRELSIEKVFGNEWFDDKVLWSFRVPGEEGDVLIVRVAEAHPLVRKWRVRVEDLAKKWGVDLGF